MATLRSKTVFLILLVFIFTSDYKVGGVNVCEYYNRTQCDNDGTGCNSVETCSPPADGERVHCFVLWSWDENDNVNVTLKGCFLNYEECYDQEDCVDTSPKEHQREHKFCCCDKDMCNEDFRRKPDPISYMEVGYSSSVAPTQDTSNVMHYVVPSLTVVVLGIIIGVGVYRWRRKKELGGYPEMSKSGSLPLITTHYVFGEEVETNDERKHLL